MPLLSLARFAYYKAFISKMLLFSFTNAIKLLRLSTSYSRVMAGLTRHHPKLTKPIE
jgi:hypothetical protein